MATTPSGLSLADAEALSAQQKITLPSNGGLFKVLGDGGTWQIGYMVNDVPHWLTKTPTGGDWGGKTQAAWRTEANSEFLQKAGLDIGKIPTVNIADFNYSLAIKHAGPGMSINQALAKAPQKSVNMNEFVNIIGGKFEEAAAQPTQDVFTSEISKNAGSAIEPTDKQPEQKSLIQIWNERPDLQKEFPDPLGKGVSGNWTLNDWWNQHGTKEYKDTQLISPAEYDALIASKTGTGGAGTGAGGGETGDTGAGGGTEGTTISNQEFADYLKSIGIDPSQVSTDTLLMASIVFETMKTAEKTGQIVDPELEITEENALAFINELEKNPLTNKTFLEFAQKELGPYYQQKIDFAKQDLNRELGELKRQYGEGIEDIGEQAAETGLAYSGRRVKQETELGEEAVRQAGSIGRQYERQYGSSSLAGLTSPEVGGSPLYSLSGGIEGELEKERETQEKLYAQQIEETYRQRKALREMV